MREAATLSTSVFITRRWIVRIASFLLACAFSSVPAYASDDSGSPSVQSAANISSTPIVIGFVGGFVHNDDSRHTEVRFAGKLREIYADRVHTQVFDNRHRKDAYQAILQWLDTDSDGGLTQDEKRAARIVLYGHSWGAAAAISLARDLQREDIPVLLTIQVDSIAKIGQNDGVVPANVAKAVNFYQTHGFLHGRPRISAEDPSRTQIVGEVRLDYEQLPQECHVYPWLYRHVFKGHASIECDPGLWSRIGALIDSSLWPPQARQLSLSAER